MTEKERTIYEWLPLELKGVDYELLHDMDGAAYAAQGEDDNGPWQDPLPALDMNLAFEVCLPKLRSEGVTAWFNGSDWFLDMVGTQNVWESTTFYDALLAYIEETQ